jgi:predicted ArsR family transcriptional regulator
MEHRNSSAIAQVALLEDDLRRQMYEFIRNRGRAVTRDEVARELRISTNLAAFHLDKLTAGGLLDARYERPADHPTTTGRAPKLYEPSDAEIEIAIPPRRYDIPGAVLLRALLTRDESETPEAAAERVGREQGVEFGESARAQLSVRRRGRERALRGAKTVLASFGYEPYVASSGNVRLRNCPFHRLARESPEVICAMNRAFVEGIVHGLGDGSIEAVLDPIQGECCVALRRSGRAA